MYPLYNFLSILCLVTLQASAAILPRSSHPNVRRSTRQNCEPFHSVFASSDISRTAFSNAPFYVVSPEGSYGTSQSGGLELYLEKPNHMIKTKGGVNDVVAEGATVNSTFTMQYGKVSFEVAAPVVHGVVTAAILIADQHDEIDIELVGGDHTHWQSNIFTTSRKDQEPLWGVFGEVEDLLEDEGQTIEATHTYTIDWNQDRIVWSVDGSVTRTLHKSQTIINGTTHYPTHASRIQLGIWDASNPVGTSEWAKGPINWKTAPNKMTATFKSVTVECPY